MTIESHVAESPRFDVSPSNSPSPATSGYEQDSTSSWNGFSGKSEALSPWRTSPLEGYKWPVFGPYRVNKTKWAETEEYWPRRLLHIPTMTSHERVNGNVYNGVRGPDYSVLSYTWGRFQTPYPQYGCSLNIHNVPWDIPSIDDTHFTVETFHDALNQITVGTDWAWVDIACIDQENVTVKMDEIGRQAAIFRKASFAYVWLSRIPLQPCFEAMILLDEVHVEEDLGLTENDRRLEILEGAFRTILSDPWFSSLWTLQEIMMRNDAMVLSSEGHIVTYCEHYVQVNAAGEFNFPKAETSNHPMSFSKLAELGQQHLDDLLDTADKIDTVMEDSVSTEEPFSSTGLSARMRDLAEKLQRSGLTELNSNNPNVQYGAAKYRKTTHAEDRIYAITQIYGLAVGQTLRPYDQPSPDELRTEFGLAVNAVSPVQGQMFVRTSSTNKCRSWCITEDSHVPTELRAYNEIKDCSSITSEADGSVFLTGQTCPLTSLLELHNGINHSWTHIFARRLQIYMDNDVAKVTEPRRDPSERWKWLIDSDLTPDTDHPRENIDFPRGVYELGRAISKYYGCDNLLVLMLGHIETGYSPSGFRNDLTIIPEYSEGPGFEQVNRSDYFVQRVGRKLFRSARTNVALLLHKLSDDIAGSGRASYERLGICTWDTTPPIDDFREDAPEEYDWEHVRGVIIDAYEEDAWQYSEAMRALFQEQTSIKVL